TTLPGGTNLTLMALARGTEPLTYQWRRYGTNLAGASSAILVFTNLNLADSGPYDVVATSTAGTTPSLVATAVVTARPPVLVQQPRSVTVLAGSSTTLNSLALGAATISYQWYFQGSPLLNQTARQLTLNPVTTNSGGAYFVLASNTFGAVSSA